MNRRMWLMVVGVLLAPAAGWSQPAEPAPAAPSENVEFDPIRCWWRTSAGAVRVGETFSLVLTCAVLDNEAVQVVPDETKLSPSVIQLVPFEVVGGSHPADLRERQRRFLQYEYQLRAINPDLIGLDVPLPNLIIGFRVNSRLPGNASQEGRELSYLLPPQLVRVTSMVPADAEDIRDTPDVGFGAIETLRSRAGLLDLAAWTLAGLGSVMVVLAVAGLFTGRRARAVAGPRLLPAAVLASVAVRELAAAEREGASQGWTDAVVDRAIAATRLAAACALGHTIGQRPADAHAEAGEGRVLVRRGPRGFAVTSGQRPWIAVSSAVTPADLTRAIDAKWPDPAHAPRETLEGLRDALATLGAAKYGRPSADRPSVEAAVSAAAAQARRVRADQWRPAALLRAWLARPGQVERAA